MPRHPSLDSAYPDDSAPIGGKLVRVGNWGEADEVRLAARTLALLADLGIKLSANSRLPQAKADLERAVQFGPGDPETEEWLAEAKRTIFEVSFIVRALADRAPEIMSRLRQMLGGPAVPERGQQDKARDAQSELLVAAALSAGGYRIDFAEPDLVVPDLMGMKTGVAIKRVSSKRADQIEKRLRQARDQLVRNRLTGIIVVNAERYLAHVYQVNRGADLSAELYRKVSEWLDYIHERDQSLNVRAVAGIATSIRLNRSTQGFDFRLHFNPKFLIGHESEAQSLQVKYEELFTRMSNGLRQIAQSL